MDESATAVEETPHNDIWVEPGPELEAAYAARAELQAEEEALRERKRANAEEIRTLEAAHVEAHSSGRVETIGAEAPAEA